MMRYNIFMLGGRDASWLPAINDFVADANAAKHLANEAPLISGFHNILNLRVAGFQSIFFTMMQAILAGFGSRRR